MLPNSGTIQDLTDILGGAIDEIGLIDSRDTPPPMVAEPSKQQQTAPTTPAQQQAQQSPAAASKQSQASSSMLETVPPRSTSQSTPSASAGVPSFTASSADSVGGSVGGGSGDFGQLSPSSIGFSTSPALSHSSTSASHPLPPTPSGGIGLGLMGAVGAASAVAGAGNLVHASTNLANTSRQQVTRHVRKASSILSIRSGSMSLNSGAPPTFSQAGPLPAAVTFGSVKMLKTSSERARGYAQSMQDLMAADSGLREWWTTAREYGCGVGGAHHYHPGSFDPSLTHKQTRPRVSMRVRSRPECSRWDLGCKSHPGPHPRWA